MEIVVETTASASAHYCAINENWIAMTNQHPGPGIHVRKFDDTHPATLTIEFSTMPLSPTFSSATIPVTVNSELAVYSECHLCDPADHLAISVHHQQSTRLPCAQHHRSSLIPNNIVFDGHSCWRQGDIRIAGVSNVISTCIQLPALTIIAISERTRSNRAAYWQIISVNIQFMLTAIFKLAFSNDGRKSAATSWREQ